MPTLALRGGERVAVVATEWRDAFAVVIQGRVQLELRDGEPGPVLGPDAGFWLHGTGVRALRNPDRRPATVRIVTRPSTNPDAIHSMEHNMNDTGIVAPSASHRIRGLAATGLIATLAAMAATTLAAALAHAAGADFEIPDGGEPIPLPGFAVVTGFFSIVGTVIAAALLRWSARPATRFLWTTVSLTAISLIPPLIAGANTATTTALIALHLIPATIMIPTLTRRLRTP
ncbi:DUF6069 family protein [Actinomadura decatromicini]|uniref:Uncharacterized protein n=1 Tax=Actinomadura decatromicini TaxID=2604572 RepID=A0A5D3FYK6_9ACTN|nr:DUF6069 family protein [Actinomadura decatromicini]TYK52820.1 hypothetical protein FXF68_03440 [Actinomadura decatromicini]